MPDLPPIKRGGQGPIDTFDFLKQKSNAGAGFDMKDFDDLESSANNEEKKEDTRSMAEVMRDKREATEKELLKKQST
jgi:hypothetical protein